MNDAVPDKQHGHGEDAMKSYAKDIGTIRIEYTYGKPSGFMVVCTLDGREYGLAVDVIKDADAKIQLLELGLLLTRFGRSIAGQK